MRTEFCLTSEGRLDTKLDYWHTIGANNFVIDTIKFGYRIPFISTPCRHCFLTMSQLWRMHFLSKLVGNCSVVEVPFVPHVVNPLCVHTILWQEKAHFRFESCLPIYLEANLVRRLESLVVVCQQGRLIFSRPSGIFGFFLGFFRYC